MPELLRIPLSDATDICEYIGSEDPVLVAPNAAVGSTFINSVTGDRYRKSQAGWVACCSCGRARKETVEP